MKGERHRTSSTELNPGCSSQESNPGPSNERRTCYHGTTKPPLTRISSRVVTCQQNVREKQNFLQVMEKSGNFEKMSGNFGHLTHVRELSGNFVMSCWGIAREFCYDIFLHGNFHYIIRDLLGFCLCKCLFGKYKLKVY